MRYLSWVYQEAIYRGIRYVCMYVCSRTSLRPGMRAELLTKGKSVNQGTFLETFDDNLEDHFSNLYGREGVYGSR